MNERWQWVVAVLLLGACGAVREAPASVADGQALFLNKGCVSCHHNERVVGNTVAPVGPNLTSYTRDAAFLRQWLADPAAVKPGTAMPQIGLSEQEINDLIAFLNAPH